MSMPLCPIQDLCPHFKSGNKPPNQDVRNKFPCQSFLDMSCEESIRIQLYLGETIACDIKEVKKKKKALKEDT